MAYGRSLAALSDAQNKTPNKNEYQTDNKQQTTNKYQTKVPKGHKIPRVSHKNVTNK